MKWILTAILFAGLVGSGTNADACGFKVLTIRRPPRHTDIQKARLPKAVSEPRPVVAARAKPRPVSAGPAQTDQRSLVAAKSPEPAPAPAAEPAPAPAPAEPAPAAAPAPTAAAPAPAPTPETTEAAPAPKGVTSEYQFKNNSAELTPRAKKQIQSTAAALKSSGASITIEGHSDASGPSEYNMELSQRRAEAVRQALVDAGVDQANIEVVALGEDRPAYKSASKNRRAAIVFKGGSKDTGVVTKDEKSR